MKQYRAITLLSWAAAAQAAPPPAPPSNVRAVALELTRAFNARDLRSYSQLFAPDVKVFWEGRMVAKDKRTWIAQVADGFKKRSQRNRPLNVGLGQNTVLIFELSSDNPKGQLQEGIAVPRAASYKLRGSQIIEVRFLGGASYLIDGKVR